MVSLQSPCPTSKRTLVHPSPRFPSSKDEHIEREIETGTPGASIEQGHRARPTYRAWLDPLLVAILVGGFIGRLIISAWRPYWYDEFLSMLTYGTIPQSTADMLSHLATNSVHPPLYQMLLMQWMRVFGHGEVATRSLSNLFVVVATAFLYLTVSRLLDRRAALGAATVFTLLYVVFFLAMEARSYALSIMLAAIAGYLVIRIIDQSLRSFPSRVALWSGEGLALSLTNIGLMFSHYYNVFLVASHAVFLLVFSIVRGPSRSRLRGLGFLVVFYLSQISVFAAFWLPSFLQQATNRTGSYSLDGMPENPLAVFVNFTVSAYLPVQQFPILSVLALTVAIAPVGWALIRISNSGDQQSNSVGHWGIIFLGVWLFFPFLFAYAGFAVSGFERYSVRYFAYTGPAFAALLVIGAVQAARSVFPTAPLRESGGWGRAVARDVLACSALVLFVLPAAYDAGTTSHDAYRDIADAVSDIVESDATGSYVLYEVTHGKEPFVDYYLKRNRTDVRVRSTIPFSDELAGTFDFEAELAEFEEHDHLIVMFPHITHDNAPNTMAILSERYHVRLAQLDATARGIVVFDVSG